jgi:hypothetical protein
MQSLHAMVGLQPVNNLQRTGQESSADHDEAQSWLYQQVFAKTPETVLRNAVALLLCESLETEVTKLSATQANLLFRKLSMARLPALHKVQENDTEATRHEHKEEYIRLQVILELLRTFVGQQNKRWPTKNDHGIDAQEARARQDGVPTDDMIRKELCKNEATVRKEAQKLLEPDPHNSAVSGGAPKTEQDAIQALQGESQRLRVHTERMQAMKRQLKRHLRLIEGHVAYAILGVDQGAGPAEVSGI